MFQNLYNALRGILKQFLPAEVLEITDTILDKIREVYLDLQEKSEESEERVRLLEGNNHSLIAENARLRDQVNELLADQHQATWMKRVVMACCKNEELLNTMVQEIAKNDLEPKICGVKFILLVKKTTLKEALRHYESIMG